MGFRAGWMKDLPSLFPKAHMPVIQRARGYLAKPRSQAISTGELIPLVRLVAMTQPPSDNVETFYDQSERLVRFLAFTNKPNFLALLDALARHQPFESALLRIYAGQFASVAALEEQFREYAAKDSEVVARRVVAAVVDRGP